jgi:hypothetical protein
LSLLVVEWLKFLNLQLLKMCCAWVQATFLPATATICEVEFNCSGSCYHLSVCVCVEGDKDMSLRVYSNKSGMQTRPCYIQCAYVITV